MPKLTLQLALLRGRKRKIEYSTIILFVLCPKLCINIVFNYAKCWRDNKEYYGIFEKGLFQFVLWASSSHILLARVTSCLSQSFDDFVRGQPALALAHWADMP